jgi:hypothetical protein
LVRKALADFTKPSALIVRALNFVVEP